MNHTRRNTRNKPSRRPFSRGRLPANKNKTKTATGIFSGTGRGYGFVLPEGAEKNPEQDVFIPAGKTHGALDGDRVAVRIRPGYERRTEGEVVSILSEGRRTLVGVLVGGGALPGDPGRGRFFRSGLFLIPDDPRIPGTFPVSPDPDSEIGDAVEVSLPGRAGGPCKVLRNFGSSASPNALCDAILAGSGIEADFDPAALRQAELAAALPLSSDGRDVLSREIVFTIDGADAKDLDDAVSLRKLPGGGWLLGVHIADVSEYVPEKTPLDREAMKRGTSVYFADRVIPMLPPALSNGACSLNADEDKYALSAFVTLLSDGAIDSCRITRTLIRSRVRGVYSEVNDLFEKGKDSPFYPKYRVVYPTLCKMRELYLLLAKKSAARGALSLDRSEPIIELDEKGEPVKVLPRERGDAEKLIEQFMLTANEAVARTLRARGFPCVYRIHEAPDPAKLAAFRRMAKNLGLDVSGVRPDDPDKSDFSPLLREAEEKGFGEQISLVLLRTMAKARYEDAPHRHFGLGLDTYCHFTSPIRRLSDLATHRAIKAVLLDGENPRRYASYVHRAAAAASEGELRALDAERRIEAVYKAMYLEKRIGEVFDARVSSLASFGLFAELDNTCEGLVPLSSLPGVYYFDDENVILVGGKVVFHLGDRIRVRVEEVDAPMGRVRFSLVEEGSEKERKKKGVLQ